MTAAQLRHATAGLATVPVYWVHADGRIELAEVVWVEYAAVESDKVDRCPAGLMLKGKKPHKEKP